MALSEIFTRCTLTAMTLYYQIIIVRSDSPRDPPFVYFIRVPKVTSEMLEEMEYQTGDYPSWCIPSEDPEDPPSLCDIETFGTRICPTGSNLKPRTITRCFCYVV